MSQGDTKFDKYAFVDEYGNANLDTSVPHVSRYFIVSAVVVNGHCLDEVRAQANSVRDRHFQDGEMKSSRVGQNDARRLRILRDIAQLPITFVSLAVNKELIRQDSGLVYQEPFLKFLHGQVYRRLYQAMSSVAIVSDEHGDAAFMTGFKRYVEERHIRGLFNKQSFEFASSRLDPLLQVADMVSGSLARHFDADKASEAADQFLEALRPITADIAEWPISYPTLDRPPTSQADDLAVEQIALDQAARFVSDNAETEDDDVYAQCCAVQYLLYRLRFVDRSSYVATKELQDVLSSEHGVNVTEHRLRSSIVAPLRDAGLLIASSQKGYKIPVSVDEMLDFVDHATNIVEPLLARVKAARTKILVSTSGGTDVLRGERYEALRKLLECC